MKCLIVETYLNIRDPKNDKEKIRNDIIEQLRTSGVAIVDGRRCKVVPCEVDMVMLKPTGTDSSMEGAIKSAMAYAAVGSLPLSPKDDIKIDMEAPTVSQVLSDLS